MGLGEAMTGRAGVSDADACAVVEGRGVGERGGRRRALLLCVHCESLPDVGVHRDSDTARVDVVMRLPYPLDVLSCLVAKQVELHHFLEVLRIGERESVDARW